MAKLSPMNWTLWRAGSGIQPSTRDVLALLDSRDAALKTLEAIVKFCPVRPTKPFCKRILEMAKTGIKEATGGQ